MITIIAEKKEQAKQYIEAFKFLGIQQITANEFNYKFYDSKVLKDQVYVTWTYGHLLQTKLPEEINPNWTFDAIDKLPFFPEQMELKVDSKPKRKKLFEHIQSLVSSSNHIVLGGDADREGALIQVQLAEYLGLFDSNKKISRLMINETGPAEVAKNIQNLQNLNYTLKQYRGAVARQYLDWVVGMNLSMIYTHQLQSLGYDFGSAFPVGRIKSVTLAMIDKRNKEYEAFVPEEFFKISVKCRCNDHEFKGRLLITDDEKRNGFDGRFYVSEGGQKLAKDYLKEHVSEHAIGKITSITDKEKSEMSPLLFSTRTLQNEMASQIPDGTHTIEIAEELYNEGYLTYPRTSTQIISEGLFSRIRQKIHIFQDLIGSGTPATQLYPRERYVNTKAISSKAHEAITITDKVPKLEEVITWSENKQKLYTTVLARCIAMFLPDYKFTERKIITTIGGLDFQSTEKAVNQSGYKELYGLEVINGEAQFEEVHVHDTVDYSFDIKNNTTKPKNKYTLISILNALATASDDSELASLVLEQSEGLGTEATRAQIVKDMISKDLIGLNKKCLELTPKGSVLVAALHYEPLLCKPLLTAKWEAAIGKVEEGRLDLPTLLEKNQVFIIQAINRAKRLTENMLPNIDTSWGFCPQCSGRLYKRKWAIECQEECGFIVKLEIAKKKLSDTQLHLLVDQGKTKLIKGFKGKNGTFNAILILDEAYKVAFEYKK